MNRILDLTYNYEYYEKAPIPTRYIWNDLLC